MWRCRWILRRCVDNWPSGFQGLSLSFSLRKIRKCTKFFNRTCWAIILVIKSFVSLRSRCHHGVGKQCIVVVDVNLFYPGCRYCRLISCHYFFLLFFFQVNAKISSLKWRPREKRMVSIIDVLLLDAQNRNRNYFEVSRFGHR